jgi:hypothetical protein
MDSLEEFLAITCVTSACDFDLLVFFSRHPDALMTSEQLALFVGYDVHQVAQSLDLLVERKLLGRSQNPTHPASLYRFRAEHWEPPLHDALKVASTVESRRQIRRLLTQRQRSKTTTPRSQSSNQISHRNSQVSGRSSAVKIQRPEVSDLEPLKEKAHG